MVQTTAERTRDRDASGKPDAPEHFAALLGWSHTTFHRGIDLRLQSKTHNTPGHGEIDNRHYLMTRNQALILAKYLLDVTGQELPARRQTGLLGRVAKRLFGRKPGSGHK